MWPISDLLVTINNILDNFYFRIMRTRYANIQPQSSSIEVFSWRWTIPSIPNFWKTHGLDLQSKRYWYANLSLEKSTYLCPVEVLLREFKKYIKILQRFAKLGHEQVQSNHCRGVFRTLSHISDWTSSQMVNSFYLSFISEKASPQMFDGASTRPCLVVVYRFIYNAPAHLNRI